MYTLDELKIFCQLQYQDCVIPLYFFMDTQLIFAFPQQTEDTYPPLKYIHKLSDNTNSISYCSTDYGIYFGCLHLHDFDNGFLILGPVSSIPYSDHVLRSMYADYVIPVEQRTAFQNFFQPCPQIPLTSLFLKLICFNYSLNHEVISISDIVGVSPVPDAAAQTMDTLYETKENRFHNQSIEIESIYLNFIRSGNPKGISSLAINESAMHTGILASNNIRQLKNIIIVTTTLATRAAIDGGLDIDAAFHLSDYYIQSAEMTNDIHVLYHLLGQINYDFAEKVAEYKVPATSDDLLQKALHYVLQHTNCRITVTDVAEYVGFSRSYFSSYFKENLGFSIGAFILRCKLEEGKQLLRYTDKSLSIISNYLCFSSQSHFQTAFRKEYGMTPLQYRKNM